MPPPSMIILYQSPTVFAIASNRVAYSMSVVGASECSFFPKSSSCTLSLRARSQGSLFVCCLWYAKISFSSSALKPCSALLSHSTDASSLRVSVRAGLRNRWVCTNFFTSCKAFWPFPVCFAVMKYERSIARISFSYLKSLTAVAKSSCFNLGSRILGVSPINNQICFTSAIFNIKRRIL